MGTVLQQLVGLHNSIHPSVVTFIGADFFQDRSSIIIATEFMDFYSLKDIAAQCGNFFFQKNLSNVPVYTIRMQKLDNMPLSHAHTRLCIQVCTCVNARNICEYHIPPLLCVCATHTGGGGGGGDVAAKFLIIINYNSLVLINHNSLIIINIM